LATGKQGRNNGKRGIFCGGSNKNDFSLFNWRQQDVLLGFGKAMNFINKNQNWFLRGRAKKIFLGFFLFFKNVFQL